MNMFAVGKRYNSMGEVAMVSRKPYRASHSERLSRVGAGCSVMTYKWDGDPKIHAQENGLPNAASVINELKWLS